MSNLSVALTYAQQGVLVFPCIEGDSSLRANAKAPYIPGGFKNASKQDYQIMSWWSKWPNAAVGLPCRSNGIVVVDADRHGAEDGVAALELLFSRNGFDPSRIPCVATPRNGLHCIFTNALATSMKASLLTAIDLRDNGYVVAAGTEMTSNLRYSLRAGSVLELAQAIGGHTLPPMPKWLRDMGKKPDKGDKQKPLKASSKDIANFAQIGGLVRKVIEARNGTRNDLLYWGSRRLAELVEHGSLSYEEAYAIGTEAGFMSGLSWTEVTATVRSAFMAPRK